MSLDYKKAGVDIEKGDELVSWLSSDRNRSPHQDQVVSGIGGFSALFRLDLKKYKNPLIVSSTDGVGTKVLLAAQSKKYFSVAQDLVGMCVNDLLCCGADPLFFLDYYACGKLDLDAAKEFLTGLRAACAEADCNLIGGETAEMPGVYKDPDFDCAGFAVGVVDEGATWGPHKVQLGDVLLALPSSGFHSNGYSLLRKVFEEDMEDWITELLTPTRLYTQTIRTLKNEIDIHALAHVTGGGLDNLLRVVPKGLSLQLRPWKIPNPFLEVKKRTQMNWDSLLKTLNCGLGMVLTVAEKDIQNFKNVAQKNKIEFMELGRVVKSSGDESHWILDEKELERANVNY
jgi:phosphoribosylformylglycinamidine cyclo-ligase